MDLKGASMGKNKNLYRKGQKILEIVSGRIFEIEQVYGGVHKADVLARFVDDSVAPNFRPLRKFQYTQRGKSWRFIHT